MYLVRLGYILRPVEEAKRTARPLDPGITGRLEQARMESPERRQALLDAALDESGSEMERDYPRRLHGAGDSEHYNGESEVFDELVLMIVGEDLADWFQGDRFFSLSGYNANVWQVVVLKATQGATASLTEADPDARLYPWEAVREFLRFGYLLRCGDEFIGYVPERIDGGDWTAVVGSDPARAPRRKPGAESEVVRLVPDPRLILRAGKEECVIGVEQWAEIRRL